MYRTKVDAQNNTCKTRLFEEQSLERKHFKLSLFTLKYFLRERIFAFFLRSFLKHERNCEFTRRAPLFGILKRSWRT